MGNTVSTNNKVSIYFLGYFNLKIGSDNLGANDIGGQKSLGTTDFRWLQ